MPCPFSLVGLMKSVAPIESAHFFLSSLVSMAMILLALLAAAPWMTARPTHPTPKTATVLPCSTFAVLVAAPYPVVTANARRLS